jgi:3-dehydroquinate dehydratase
MGEKGKLSRISSCQMEGFLTFACLDEKNKTADSQMTIEEMIDIQKKLFL